MQEIPLFILCTPDLFLDSQLKEQQCERVKWAMFPTHIHSYTPM